MRRPKALYPEELRFRFDRWIEAHCLVYEQSGPEWLIDCPRCGREKLAVNVDMKAFHCFVCPFAGWHPVQLVAAVLAVNEAEARQIAAQDASGVATGPIVVELRDDPAVVRPDESLPPGAFPWTAPLDDAAAHYLRMRGIPPEHAIGLGACSVISNGDDTKANRALQGRVLFPIWNSVSRPVFWAARATHNETTAKVINMPKPCRKMRHPPDCTCYHEEWGLRPVKGAAGADEVLMGLHWLRPGEPAILVEGVTDVAVCGPGFAAALGAHLSLAQAVLLARSGVSEVVLLFDGDAGGAKGLIQAESMLRQLSVPVRGVLCPNETDPGSLGREKALEVVMSAPPVGGVRTLGLTASSIRPKLRKALKPIVAPLKGP